MSSRHSTFRMRSVSVVVLCCLGCVVSARGGALTYETEGNIRPWTFGNGALPAITGPNVISFEGIPEGAFHAPGTFSLGRFVIGPLPAGTTATYHNAAFSLSLTTSLGDGTMSRPNDLPYSRISLYGALDGVVSSNNRSTVVARILEIQPSPMISFPESPIHPVLDLPFPLSSFSAASPLNLVPAAIDGGQTIVLARVTAVPEPLPAALLLLALGGLALLRAHSRNQGPWGGGSKVGKRGEAFSDGPSRSSKMNL